MSTRVAFYANDITLLAGTERATFAVANKLAESPDFEVYIISTNGERSDVKMPLHQDIRVINLKIKNLKLGLLRLFISLKRTLVAFNIQSLVSVEMMSVPFTLPVLLYLHAIGKKVKHIAWEHLNFTVDLGNRIRPLSRKLAARFADEIVVLTSQDVQLWNSNLNIRNNIQCIPNPSPFAISETDYRPGSKNIIAVGRLAYQKGFDILVQLWADFLSKYSVDMGWRLQIIGSGKDEYLLKELVRKNNLENRIEMISNTTNISRYYENASFLAMTSRFEGLPMTLIEAQSYGLPIIAFDCITGPSDVVTGKSGFLIKEQDNISFLDSMYSLISNEELRIEMGAAAKKEASRFSSKEVNEAWKRIL